MICPFISYRKDNSDKKSCLGEKCALWNEDCLIKLALQKYIDPLSLKKTNSDSFSSSTSPTFKPPAFNPFSDWSVL